MYEPELVDVLRKARAKVDAGEDAGDLLGEADELIAQLRIDARSKEAKKSVASYADQVQDLRNRGSLLPQPTLKTDARSRLLESSRRLDDTRELINEIEETGNDIITELERNRDTIQKIDSSVKDTRSDLDKADKTVTKMSKWYVVLL